MPDPIVINITATPDPNDSGKLLVTAVPSVVLLAFEDDDQVRWVCQDGEMEIRFGPANNPFDASANSGGTYVGQPDGSQVSGSLAEELLNPNAELFNDYKYTIVVTNFDKTRVGALDPRFKTRRRTVYKGTTNPNE